MADLKNTLDLTAMLKEVRTIGGFADGNYTCTCKDCDRVFIGDKRSRQCLPCAVSNLELWAKFGMDVVDILDNHQKAALKAVKEKADGQPVR